MLVGLKSYWKCPGGYFYTDKCGSEIQVSLIKICLSLAADHGLRVWSVTCDGTYANVNTLKLLGCTFPDNFENMNVKFKHPTRDYHVYGTLDGCHMLKLARNALGDLGKIRSPEGNIISWDFIKKLHMLQEEEGLNLANKLHVNHICWRRHKMKVKLAAQTFSSSVADALEFLQNDIKHESFQNCSATIQFIRNIDRLFDVLNSRHPYMSGFKSPIRNSNLNMITSVILQISNYLLTLKDFHGQPLIYHRRKTFIIGFVSTAKSLISISEELLNRAANPYKYVLTYKFSQDHIELLFSCIRSRGGFNNNPNTLQFRTALKQILMRNSIMPSNKANVIAFEPQSHGSIFSLQASKRRTPMSEMSTVVASNEEDDDLQQIFDKIQVDTITNNILYYISGFIIRKLIKSIDCTQCSEALVLSTAISDHQYCSSPYSSLVNRKNRGGLIQSSHGAYQVVVQCEKSFRINVINANNIK